ncbi:MAG: hypothetical protein IPJ71_03590 [Bdellovibrionales bacterium]|nr:hypothetical protein [Bdellovibrionales bacterium]
MKIRKNFISRLKSESDYKIVVVATLVFIITTYLLIFGHLRPFEHETIDREKVGTVTLAKNSVTVHHERGLHWLDLRTGDDIYENDRVFTSRDSIAKLTLNSGFLEMGPSTLVVITTQGDKPHLDLLYGTLLGKFSGNPDFIIKQGKQKIFIGGENTSLGLQTKQNGNGELQVYQGSIGLTDENGNKKLSAPASLNLDGIHSADLNQTKIFLIRPENESTIELSEIQEMEFAWKFDGENASSQEMKLEFSTDLGFSKVLESIKVSGNSTQMRPTEALRGSMFWRIVRVEGGKRIEESIPYRIFFKDMSSPVLEYPEIDQSFVRSENISDSHRQLSFRWKGNDIVNRFQFQISTSADFSQIVEDEIQVGSERTTEWPPDGRYFWRVRGLYSKDEVTQWSGTGRYLVGMRSFLSPLTLRTHLIELELTNRSARKIYWNKGSDIPYVRFEKPLKRIEWDPHAFGGSYQVELSMSESFENVTMVETKDSQLPLFQFSIGTTYFRVRSKLFDNYFTEFSAIGKIVLKVPPTDILGMNLLSNFLVNTDKEIGIMSVYKLKWMKSALAGNFKVEFSQTEEFDNPRVLYTNKDTDNIVLPEGEDGWIRVVSLNSIKQEISDYSRPLNVARTLLNLKDNEELLPSLRITNREPSSNLVSVNGAPIYYVFSWEKITQARQYEIEVSRDPSFREILAKYKTETNHYSSTRSLSEGLVFWRVRAVDGARIVSRWSAIQPIRILRR